MRLITSNNIFDIPEKKKTSAYQQCFIEHLQIHNQKVEQLIEQLRLIKFLIVEDDDNFLLAIQAMLRVSKIGHVIETAKNGLDAINYLAEVKNGIFPMPDIMVLDLVVPGLDGHGVLDYIQEYKELASIFVIVLSAFLDADKEEELIKRGVKACFDKPLDIKKFQEVVLSHEKAKIGIQEK